MRMRKACWTVLALGFVCFLAPSANASEFICRRLDDDHGMISNAYGWYAVRCVSDDKTQFAGSVIACFLGHPEGVRNCDVPLVPGSADVYVKTEVNERHPCVHLACQSATFPRPGGGTAVRGVPSGMVMSTMPEQMAVFCTCYDDEEGTE